MPNTEIAKKFIAIFFRKGSTWEDLAPYVEGDGEFNHPLLKGKSIREAFATLDPFRSSFPDIMQTVESAAVAENGNLWVKTEVSATFSGSFAGVEGNGRHWVIPDFWEFKIRDGKITYASELCNHHEINQQLGLVLFKAPFEQGQVPFEKEERK